jgi:hypothetical protein
VVLLELAPALAELLELRLRRQALAVANGVDPD